MTDPYVWYICQHDWGILMVNVAITMAYIHGSVMGNRGRLLYDINLHQIAQSFLGMDGMDQSFSPSHGPFFWVFQPEKLKKTNGIIPVEMLVPKLEKDEIC